MTVIITAFFILTILSHSRDRMYFSKALLLQIFLKKLKSLCHIETIVISYVVIVAQTIVVDKMYVEFNKVF